MTTRVLKLILLAGLLAASREGAAADPASLLPDGMRLGMDRRAVMALEPAPLRIDPPLVYGPLLGEFVDKRFAALGPEGIAYYQLDSGTGRLRQLLLEWRDGRASQGRAARMLEELEARLGPPSVRCLVALADAPPRVVAARWDGVEAVLHVSLFDHRTGGIAYFDLNTSSDPRQPSRERRRISRRSLPRRLIARLHAADDSALTPRRECPAGSAPGAG